MSFLTETLRIQVERYKRRAQRLTLAEGLSQTAAVFLGLVAVTFLLDRWLFLPLAARVGLTAVVWLATIAGSVWFVYLPLRKRWSDIEVAFNVEAAHPELDEELASAVELSQSSDPDDIKGSPRLIEALVNDLAQRTSGLDFASAISPKRAAASGAAAAALLAGLGIYALAGTEHFLLLAKRFINPLALLPRASSVKLDVKPGDAVVEAGSGVTVRVGASDARVRKAAVFFAADGLPTLRFDAPGSTAAQGATKFPARFEVPLPGVKSNAIYFVRAGDAESRRYRLTAQRGPRLQRFTLTYHYPDYTKLPPKTVTGETADIAAVAGTRVVVQAGATEKLREAWLELNGTPPRPLMLADDRSVFAELNVERDAEFKLRVTSAAGFRNTDAISYHIKALPDLPPAVKLLDPDQDITIARPEPLPLKFEAADDFGVHSAYLVHNGKRDQMPLSGAETFNLALAGYKPGDEITFWIEVVDSSPARQTARSEQRVVRISELADLSLQSRDFAELKKLRETLGLLRKQMSDARQAVERLRADFARQGRWDNNLATRAAALGRDLLAAQDTARAAVGLMEGCCASPRSPQALRDWENVGNLLDQAIERAASGQRSAESLGGEGHPASDPGSTLARLAEMSATAADVSAGLDDGFGRLYDGRQMEVLSALARRIYRSEQRVADTIEQASRSSRRQTWQLAADQQEAVDTATQQLSAGLAAADALLPQNTELLRAARERLAAFAGPRQQRLTSGLKNKRGSFSREEMAALLEALRATSEELSKAETASADAANATRGQWERSRVELSQRFMAASQTPDSALRAQISELVARLDQQAEPHLTRAAGDNQWGSDLLLVRESLRKLTEAGTAQSAAAQLRQLGEQLNLLERQRDLRLMVRGLRGLEQRQAGVTQGIEQAASWQRLRFGQLGDTERDVRAELAPFGGRLHSLVGRVAPVDAAAGRDIEAVGRQFAASGLLPRLEETASLTEAGEKARALPMAAAIKDALAALRAALERILRTRMENAQQARAQLQQQQPTPAERVERLAKQQDALAKQTQQPAQAAENRQPLREEQEQLRADARAVQRQLMAQAHPADEAQQPHADQMRDLHDAALKIAQVEQQEMAAASQALKRNKAPAAAQQQQAAAEKLHQTAQQLAAVHKDQQMAAQAAQAGALAREQEKLMEQAQASQPQALRAQAQPQRSLAAQVEDLKKTVEKSNAPEAAPAMAEAKHAMQQAANALQAANQRAATDNQRAAMQGLQQAAQKLQQARQATAQQAAQARSRLQQAEQMLPNQQEVARGYDWMKKLDEVAAQQNDVARRAAANEPARPLANQQAGVKQQMKNELQNDPAVRNAQLNQAMDNLKAAAQAVAELARKEKEVADQVNQVRGERESRQKSLERQAEGLARATEKTARQAGEHAAPLQQAAQAMKTAADAIQRDDFNAARQQAEQSAQALRQQAERLKEQARQEQSANRRDRRKTGNASRAAALMDSLARREASLAEQLKQHGANKSDWLDKLAADQLQMRQDLQRLGKELAESRNDLQQTAPEVAQAMEGAAEAAAEKIPPPMQNSAEHMKARNTLQAEKDARSAQQELSKLAEQLAKAADKASSATQPAAEGSTIPPGLVEQSAAVLQSAGKQMDEARNAFEQGQTPKGQPPAKAAADSLQELVAGAAQTQQQQVLSGLQQAQQQAQQMAEASESQTRESDQGIAPRGAVQYGTGNAMVPGGALADLDKLPAELKQGLTHGMRESYPPEYETLIKQYFQKLSRSAR